MSDRIRVQETRSYEDRGSENISIPKKQASPDILELRRILRERGDRFEQLAKEGLISTDSLAHMKMVAGVE